MTLNWIRFFHDAIPTEPLQILMLPLASISNVTQC